MPDNNMWYERIEENVNSNKRKTATKPKLETKTFEVTVILSLIQVRFIRLKQTMRSSINLTEDFRL